MSTLVWIHEDSLHTEDPALVAYPGEPAVFVWDDASLDEDGYALKRLVFIYECLLELPVRIVRGDTETALLAVSREVGAERIATTWSVNPRWTERVRALERSVPVEVLPAHELIPKNLDADLRCFARFWKKAEPYVFRRRG